MAKPLEKMYLVSKHQVPNLKFYHRNDKYAPYEFYVGPPKFDPRIYPLKPFRTFVNE